MVILRVWGTDTILPNTDHSLFELEGAQRTALVCGGAVAAGLHRIRFKPNKELLIYHHNGACAGVLFRRDQTGGVKSFLSIVNLKSQTPIPLFNRTSVTTRYLKC